VPVYFLKAKKDIKKQQIIFRFRTYTLAVQVVYTLNYSLHFTRKSLRGWGGGGGSGAVRGERGLVGGLKGCDGGHTG
jgi:hypothetical protein